MKLTECTLCGAEYMLKTSPSKDHLCTFRLKYPHPDDAVKDLEQQLSATQAQLASALAELEKERQYIKKLDGIIEEVGGVTVSCLNPYEDLKNTIIKLKARAEAAEKELEESKAKVEKFAAKVQELEFAYKRAKVLADMFGIPVHESEDVTGTILGLVRGAVERSNKKLEAAEKKCEGLQAELEEWQNHTEAMQSRAKNAEQKCVELEKERALKLSPLSARGVCVLQMEFFL